MHLFSFNLMFWLHSFIYTKKCEQALTEWIYLEDLHSTLPPGILFFSLDQFYSLLKKYFECMCGGQVKYQNS